MALVVVIFARGGSKGLPGKNLMMLGNVHLIGHSINLAKQLHKASRIICSTDSDEIASIASTYGAEVPFLRPSSLASDTSPEIDSWKHAAQFLLDQGHRRDDFFVSLPATAPLRQRVDVEEAISLAESANWDLVVTYSEASHNPWFNMVTKDSEGEIRIANDSREGSITHRQNAPKVYNLVPVAYVTTLGYVIDTSDLFSGRVGGVEVPRERSVDIDTRLDLEIVQFLYQLESGHR